MRAAVFKDVGVLSIEDRPTPAVTGDEDVLVRVGACGICGSDLHILHVPPHIEAAPGTILGHEIVGDVVEAGVGVTSVGVGDRVAIRPILSCDTCRQCRLGRTNLCSNATPLGVTRDGGMAEYVLVPEAACNAMSARVPLPVAALAEPLACVVSAARKAHLFPGEDVVILGGGPIGLLFLAVLRSAGAGRIVVVEPTAARADVARIMRADAVVGAAAGGVAAAIAAELPDGPELLIDAVGSQLATAIIVAGPRARIIVFGQNGAANPAVHQQEITTRELTIIGSFVGQDAFPEAVALLESGRLDVSPIVSHTGSLEDLPGLIDQTREGRVVKAVILPGQHRA